MFGVVERHVSSLAINRRLEVVVVATVAGECLVFSGADLNANFDFDFNSVSRFDLASRLTRLVIVLVVAAVVIVGGNMNEKEREKEREKSHYFEVLLSSSRRS